MRPLVVESRHLVQQEARGAAAGCRDAQYRVAFNNPAGDRFTQSWEGVRLVVDIHSDTGIGRAVLKPRDQGWPLRLAFRLHLSAVEGFEVRGAQNLRWSLGQDPLTEPAMIDLPAGAYAKDSPEIEVQWVDHYR